MPDKGPYESERQAHAAAVAAVAPDEGWSILREAGCRELLHRALSDAGVETSAFEDRTIAWLAGWEDYVCAIIAGWVTRAAQAQPKDDQP